jgi:hypothetical protein
MEYGTILVATAAPGEHLMALHEDRGDWTYLVLMSDNEGDAGRIVWVPEEVLRDDPAYMEAPR